MISRPAACKERIAVSRPEPGPFTNTSTLRRPCSWAIFAAASAAICAANGVDLREPLKPTVPADCHEITLPDGSVMRDDRVVERALDVRLTDRDVLALAALQSGAWRSSSWQPCATCPSSSRRSGDADPCGCARSCACAGRGPADRGDDEDRGSSRSPSDA